jgi:hypothetical protein
VLGDPARQFRTGGLGTGHAMKALNNVIGAATYCATAEALVAGRRSGLDPETMIAIINASTGRSFVSELVFGPEVLTGRYRTGFARPPTSPRPTWPGGMTASGSSSGRGPRGQTGLNGRYLWLRTSSVSCVTPGRQPT